MGQKTQFYKICIVGDYSVGKSTLLHRYLERRFISNVKSTIGSNFFVKHLKIPNVKSIVTLQIWDLAGQDHFKWVRQAFYKGAKGIVFVFDLSRILTFQHIEIWYEEVENSAGFIPNILVGNKCDLINPSKHDIPIDDKDSLKEQINACAYEETSAKSGKGVDDIFTKLTIEMNKFYNK
ncbi:MAG: Rab family GTPase [Promethearchaeota archaeon]